MENQEGEPTLRRRTDRSHPWEPVEQFPRIIYPAVTLNALRNQLAGSAAQAPYFLENYSQLPGALTKHTKPNLRAGPPLKRAFRSSKVEMFRRMREAETSHGSSIVRDSAEVRGAAEDSRRLCSKEKWSQGRALFCFRATSSQTDQQSFRKVWQLDGKRKPVRFLKFSYLVAECGELGSDLE
jgi:hypothetical protein